MENVTLSVVKRVDSSVFSGVCALLMTASTLQGDRRRVLGASDHIQRGGYAAPLVYFQGSSGRAKVLLLADGSFYRGSLCRLLSRKSHPSASTRLSHRNLHSCLRVIALPSLQR